MHGQSLTDMVCAAHACISSQNALPGMPSDQITDHHMLAASPHPHMPFRFTFCVSSTARPCEVIIPEGNAMQPLTGLEVPHSGCQLGIMCQLLTAMIEEAVHWLC